MVERQIAITEGQWQSVVRHLEGCLPEEGCGLLAGRGGQVELVLPIENSEHSPIRYFMEPRALVAALLRMEDLDLELLAAFHSHPTGPVGVSDTDVREWLYPEAALVVCMPGNLGWVGQAFVVADGNVTEIPLRIGKS
jgi:proteasome lid subunit RPN8/RPN11